MRNEFRRNRLILGRPRCGCRLGWGRRMARSQGFFSVEEPFDVHDVVSARLGRGVNRGQSTADHQDGHPDLEVRRGVATASPGRLQGHQEVARGPNTAREPARDLDHRGGTGAGGEGDMVKTHGESIVKRQGPAQTNSSGQSELIAPLEQQSHQGQEILVPTDRDPVFGDPAEAARHAGRQRLEDRLDLNHRLEIDPVEVVAGVLRVDPGRQQRLKLEPIDGEHRMTVLDQVMGEREASRSESGNQHLATGRWAWQWALEIERVPAR